MAGLRLDEIGVIELNEAFAVQALAVIRRAGIDPERVNVNGGAIALGHPLGCTGAKLTATILREMSRGGSRYGMVTMCVGGVVRVRRGYLNACNVVGQAILPAAAFQAARSDAMPRSFGAGVRKTSAG